MSDEGRLVADRYRIMERLGSGAMGAVWHAQDELLHRDVAIKQLLLEPGLDEKQAEDARQRTMREARLAARLHHPNAISVFDVVTDEHGQPCLIMEFVPSTSLAAVLQQEHTLDPLEVAQIGSQIASALRDAHQVGVVHRDIKPGNVLLGNNGAVKLTDFGISRATDDVTVTKTGMIAGTPAYLAPEVAVGGNPGPESDVFSLGSTLYAATEGQPPFGLSENTLSLLHAVAAGQINPPRQSGPLASVLAVMLHPEVEHRPTAEESEDLLAAVARGETPLGGTPSGTTIATGAAAGGLAAAAAATAGDTEVAQAGYPGNGVEQADLQGSRSGTLSGSLGPGTTVQEGPYETAVDYPDQDYDDTRAMTAGYPGYSDHDDYHDDYAAAGYHDDEDDGAPAVAPIDEDPEDEHRGNWKLPVIIGAVTVAGLVALAIWIFSPPSVSDEANQPPVPAPSTSSTTTSHEPTSTTTTETSSTTTEYVPNPGPDTGYNPPPVQDAPPEDTTTQETTSSDPPGNNSDDSDNNKNPGGPDDPPTDNDPTTGSSPTTTTGGGNGGGSGSDQGGGNGGGNDQGGGNKQ